MAGLLPLPAPTPSSPRAISRSSSVSSTTTLVPSTPSTPPDKAFTLHPACLTLSGAALSKPIRSSLTPALASLSRPLRIVGLLATPDTGCRTYASMTARACAAADVCQFQVLEVEHDFDAVLGTIRRLNADPGVDGLIVYFSLFGGEDDALLRAAIDPRIDVEGVNPLSVARSATCAPGPVFSPHHGQGGGVVYPCTALAVFRALQHPAISLYNGGEGFAATVTVINRSETVGRPLAAMLANAGARVYSVDIDSTYLYEPDSQQGHTATRADMSLSDMLARSDAVVAAVPGKFTVPTASLRPGVAAIDVSEHGNFEPDVRDRAGVFVPRLGALTILMLQLNALVLRRSTDGM